MRLRSLLKTRTHPYGAFALGLAALFVLAIPFAHATTAVLWDLPKLIERSDMIVRAHVIAKKTKLNTKYNMIATDTTLRVSHSFWGSAKKGGNVTISQFGGTLNGETTVIHGDASFEMGEEVIVFLRKGKGENYLTAMAQSKYTVQRKSNSQTFIYRDLSDIAFYNAQAPGKIKKVTEAPKPQAFFLAELEALIAGIKQTNQTSKEGGK